MLKSEPKLWIANGVGFLLSLYYTLTFTRFAPKHTRSPTLPGSVQEHIQIISGISLAVLILARANKAEAIGNLGVLICIMMYASPLAAAKNVIATKSAESIPLPFTMASIICCVLWAMVGIYDMNDIYVYFPCILGLACGAIQVALKLLYGDGYTKKQKHESSGLLNSVEMSL